MNVALFASAWIETVFYPRANLYDLVALFASAWIETGLGTRENAYTTVALFASAWIETPVVKCISEEQSRRALRERVD